MPINISNDAIDLHIVTEGFVRPNLMRSVADHLRTITGRPGLDGARLPGERELSDALNISRPVLRAALAKLEAEGRIVRRHGHGTRVVSPRVHDAVLAAMTMA